MRQVLLHILWHWLFVHHTKGSSSCPLSVDICFVLDKSSSVTPANFVHVQQFAANVVSKFQSSVAKQEVQVGLVLFAGTAHTDFYFKTYGTNTSSIVFRIQQTQCCTANTFIGAGLTTAKNSVFLGINGDNKTSSNIVVLLTDGKSDDDAITPSTTLKDNNVAIFAVGVGASVDEAELRAVVSSPSASHLVLASSFTDLPNITSAAVIDLLCQHFNPEDTSWWTPSRAVAIGISAGIVVLVVAFSLVLAWKNRKFCNSKTSPDTGEKKHKNKKKKDKKKKKKKKSEKSEESDVKIEEYM